ncbi:hypothetical protein [Fictibacillus phosphorivorans]|uniref:hypothetical protein n=1 Tax=Fictibacillus phosphorivorans TaxID=1221500 RepID=UPI0016435EF4|nr:hypothetical protein [Fictibacillus phosphorivorans]
MLNDVTFVDNEAEEKTISYLREEDENVQAHREAYLEAFSKPGAYKRDLEEVK